METKSNYHSLSFCERVHNPHCRVRYSLDSEPVYTLQRVSEYDEKTKRVVTRSKFSLLDNSSLKHLKVSDFSISCLLAVGAALEPSPLMKHDIHTSSNMAISAVESIVKQSQNNQ